MMKPLLFFVAFLILLSIVLPVAAYNPNYTSTFNNTDVVRINQSLIQDPTSTNAVKWELWIYSGFIGLILIVISLLKPRLYRMDYEINIIVSVLSWPFCWYFTWGALTTVDRLVGVGMTATDGTAVMITQHILYTFPIIGAIGLGGDIVAIFITVILIAQFKLFKENEEQQNQNQSQ